MSNSVAAFLLATCVWVICIAITAFAPVKRSAGEAWVVTASEKMPNRPALVRGHVRFDTATGTSARTGG